MNLFAFCKRSAPLLITAGLLAAPAQANYAQRPEVRAFAGEMAVKHAFNKDELLRLLGQAKRQDSIIEAMSRAKERTLEWFEYRKIFVTEKRVAAGIKYRAEHAGTLAKAEARFGVPAEIIAAIIGVETNYGTYPMKHGVLDALTTLSFDFPVEAVGRDRQPFFRQQLEEYLVLTRTERVNPLNMKGSYAGAMGIPQFMPDSYRKYAYDMDHDGLRDLWSNHRDAIGSVANYFIEKGRWQAGGQVAFPVVTRGDGFKQLVGRKGASPTLRRWQQLGVTIPTGLSLDARGEVIKLGGKDGPEYWLVLKNFFAIKKYNPSDLYAMAVFQLAEAIREGHALNQR